ncbi:MAG: HEAT repeat domain-containing protein [Candidatus Micrarchaeota archaeon]
MDDETRAHVMDIRTHPNPKARRSAARRLGQICDPETIPDLVAALSDPSFDVRSTAANALRTMRDKSAVPGLIAALEKEEDSEVKIALVKALGAMKDEKAIPALAEAMGDESMDVQNEAKEGLLKFGARAVPVFIEALGNGKNALPWIASRALMTLAQKHDIPLDDVGEALNGWASDASKDEREEVRMSIGEIYRDIAAKVAERKKRLSRGGVLSEGTVKAPRKPRTYRVLRVVYG